MSPNDAATIVLGIICFSANLKNVRGENGTGQGISYRRKSPVTQNRNVETSLMKTAVMIAVLSKESKESVHIVLGCANAVVMRKNA